MHISQASAAAVTSFLLMFVMGAGGAGAAPQAVVNASPAGARLLVRGRLVSLLRTPNGGLTPKQRADLAAERLNGLLAKGLKPAQIETRSRGADWGVYAAGALIMIATPAEARARSEQPRATAARWAGNLKSAISGGSSRLSPPAASEPALGVASSSLVVPVGSARANALKSKGAGAISVESSDPAIAAAEITAGGRSVRIRGIAPGRALIVLRKGDAGAEFTVDVKKPAASSAGSGEVKITGTRLPLDSLRSLVEAEALAQVVTEPGASVRVTGAPALKLPAPGSSTVVPAPVVADGPEYIKSVVRVPVRIRNIVLPHRKGDRLLYSNHPESVRAHQRLYAGVAPGGEKTRLLYHHQNRTSGPFVFQIHLINPGDQAVDVQIVGGEAGPFINPLQTGHRAAEKYFRALDSDSGYITTVPPDGSVLVYSAVVPLPDTVSGIYDFRVLGDQELIVHVASDRAVTAPRPTPALLAAARSEPHTYDVTEKPVTSSYRVGENWAFIPLGRTAIEAPESDRRLFGNYGVIYDAHVDVENPHDQTRTIEVLLNPEAGWARGVFVIEGQVIEAPQIRPPADAVLYSFRLPAGGKRRIRIRSIPAGGGAYPVSIVIRS